MEPEHYVLLWAANAVAARRAGDYSGCDVHTAQRSTELLCTLARCSARRAVIEQANTAAWRLEKQPLKRRKSISCLKKKIKRLQCGRGLDTFDLFPSADVPLKRYGVIFK